MYILNVTKKLCLVTQMKRLNALRTIQISLAIFNVLFWLNIKYGTHLIQLKIVKWSPFELNVQFRVTI